MIDRLLKIILFLSITNNMSKFRGGALGSPVPRRGGKGGKSKSGLDEEAMEEIKEAFNLFDTEGKCVCYII